MDSEKKELERYELRPTRVGTFVYALKESCAQGEYIHYLCPECKNHKGLAVLQPDIGKGKMKCLRCKESFYIDAPPPKPFIEIYD